MNQTSGTKVFILGAGCSVDCGYPLGKGLAGQLEEFQIEISSCFPIIEKCVREAINLAKEFPQFDTLDQLTQGIKDNYKHWAIDSRHMVETLLNKATQCEKIIIQNPAVQNVRAALASYTQLNGRLEFDASSFGENL